MSLNGPQRWTTLDRSVNWRRQTSCRCSGVLTTMCQSTSWVTSPVCVKSSSISAPIRSSLLSAAVSLSVSLSTDRRPNTPPFDPTARLPSLGIRPRAATFTPLTQKDQSHPHCHHPPCFRAATIDLLWSFSNDTTCVQKQAALFITSLHQHPLDADRLTSVLRLHLSLPKPERVPQGR